MPAFMVPERSQRILLTEIDLDIVAPPGSAVRIIDELVESLDTSEIEAHYDVASDVGRPPFHPKTLVKVAMLALHNKCKVPGAYPHLEFPSSKSLEGHLPAIFLVPSPPTLMRTLTASSIGSLKGTSIRSRPCSYVASALSGFTAQPKAKDATYSMSLASADRWTLSSRHLEIDGIRWRSWDGELQYQLAVLRVSICHIVRGNLHSIFGHLCTLLFYLCTM